MPTYKTIIAKTKRDAYDQLMKELDYNNLQVIKEGEITTKKRKFFKTIKETWYEMKVARYSKELGEAKDKRVYREKEIISLKAPPNKSRQSINRRKGERKFEEFEENRMEKRLEKRVDRVREVTKKNPAPNPISKKKISASKEKFSPEEFQKIIRNHQKKIGFTHMVNGANAFSPSSSSSFRTFNQAKEKIFTFNADADLLTRKKPNQAKSTNQDLFKNKIIHEFLKTKEFSAPFIKEILSHSLIDNLDSERNYRSLAETITNFISFGEPLSKFKTSKKKKVIYFVGSTGVGKTTSLCKMAASFHIIENETLDRETQLELGSFDIRRLMAISQLEKFSNLLDINFTRLDKTGDLDKLLKQGGKSIYLIDTSGISFREDEVIEETISFLNIPNIHEKEVVFCFSAGQQFKDTKNLLSKISNFNINQAIITKTDDSNSLGAALSVLYENKFPLTYITNGQDIPNDIKFVDKDELVNLLLNEWLYEKSNI